MGFPRLVLFLNYTLTTERQSAVHTVKFEIFPVMELAIPKAFCISLEKVLHVLQVITGVGTEVLIRLWRRVPSGTLIYLVPLLITIVAEKSFLVSTINVCRLLAFVTVFIHLTFLRNDLGNWVFRHYFEGDFESRHQLFSRVKQIISAIHITVFSNILFKLHIERIIVFR